MAIHMDKDPTEGRGGNQENRRREGGGGGGLGNLTRFLPIILFFLFKRPKLAIGLLLVAGALYLFSGGDLTSLLGGGGGGGGNMPNSEALPFMGCDMNQDIYDKAMVYEPLAAGNSNRLPSQVSLVDYSPKVLNQGRQGSCVGWSSAYAARTILHAKATGKKPDDISFSPSYLYNQIALTGCQGAYIFEAMDKMKQTGGLPFSDFGYNEATCSRKPDAGQISLGENFRIKGYNRLSKDHNKYEVNTLAIKQNLAQGAPVVIGMMVGGSFMTSMYGREVWEPTRSDYNQSGFGGHAMCVIGYDDNKAGGAFEIMNSWGESWGKKGIGWVKYRDFEHFTREAYGLYPMGDHKKQTDGKLKVGFGIVDYQKQKFIALNNVAGNVFRTKTKVLPNDRFKVQVTNNVECYTYIFNENPDGSSDVLFPYTKQHSPYCGITGTRLFPKDYSMVPDDVGNRDRIAIVITKNELNYEDIKNKINRSRRSSFADRVTEALGSQLATNVQFQSDEYITFEADLKNKNAVAMIVEVDK